MRAMQVTVRERTFIAVRPEILLDFIASEDGFLSFGGFGPVPPIKTIAFEKGNAKQAGSVLRVTNGDGSTHRETITGYEPGRLFSVRVDELSSVFGKLVAFGDERYELQPEGEGTALFRVFAFELRTPLVLPLMIPIVHGFIRGALRRHHRGMQLWAEARRAVGASA
jgi:hypothetical protein